ncbi:MAG: MBL fold metallo-hydrolase [Thermoplasmatota archaeon]
MYLEDGYKVHIDPGPGALTAMRRNRIDPLRTDGILISHCHPDHYSDAEPIMEGLGLGRRGRWGFLIGPVSVIKGKGRIGPAVSRYHKSRIRRVITVRSGDDFKVMGLSGRATPSIHSDPESVGFKLHTKNGILSYIADTEITDEIVKAHRGSRILVMAVTRPLGSRIPNHLTTEDGAQIAEEIGPELCLLTHQGKKFLKEDPSRQSRYIEERSGIRTIPAEDDMIVSFKEGIDIFSRKKSRAIPV